MGLARVRSGWVSDETGVVGAGEGYRECLNRVELEEKGRKGKRRVGKLVMRWEVMQG